MRSSKKSVPIKTKKFITKNDLITFLKSIDYKLFVIIIITLLIPTIYRTTRIFFIGQINDGYNYSIASQIQWLNILYEIITESIIVPMFFTLTKIKEKMDNNMVDEARSDFSILAAIISSLFLLFTIIINFVLPNILESVSNNDEYIYGKSLEYMRFEIWAILLTSIASFFIISSSILKLKNYWTISLLVNLAYLVTNVLLDLFIVSDNDFSLKLEYVGVGVSSIVSSFVLLTLSLSYFMFKSTRMFTIKFHINKSEIKISLSIYFKNLILASIETLTRNLVFTFMILKMMSNIGEQGTYWLANNFIWTWLLLPISIISLFIKETNESRIIFEDKGKDLKYKLLFYYGLTIIVILIWCCLIPVNQHFIKNVMGVKTDYLKVSNLVMVLFGFYVCYAFSSVIDAIFISQGRVGLFLIQTIIVNATVYPIYYILYKNSMWVPSVNSIAIMFGVGLLVDLIVDVMIFVALIKYKDPYKKMNKCLQEKLSIFLEKMKSKKPILEINDEQHEVE